MASTTPVQLLAAIVIPGAGQVAALVHSTGTKILRLTSGAIGHFQGES